MKYTGPSGESRMRAEDDQLIAPVYILSLAQARQPGVKQDVDGSGFGWKTETLIEAKDTVPALGQLDEPGTEILPAKIAYSYHSPRRISRIHGDDVLCQIHANSRNIHLGLPLSS